MKVLEIPRFGGPLLEGRAHAYRVYKVRSETAAERRVIRAGSSSSTHGSVIRARFVGELAAQPPADFLDIQDLGGGMISMCPDGTSTVFVFVGGPDVDPDDDPNATAAVLELETEDLTIRVIRPQARAPSSSS